MTPHLTWKKGNFSDKYILMADGTQRGSLKRGAWSRNTAGILEGRKYTFKRKGVFHQHTIIYDQETNEEVGNIDFNSWRSRATLTLPTGETYHWKYLNFRQSSWSLADDNDTFVTYRASFFSNTGDITGNTSNEVLLLTGLYIARHYFESAAVVVVITFFILTTGQ
jgi:hypothetical protein